MKNYFLCSLILAGMLGKSARAATPVDTAKRAVLTPDDTAAWKINKLKAPSSPGASLLGISPNAIQRPTDPSAFMVSFLNATNNLSTIPNSYAVDFAPAWLFFGQHITYRDFKSNDIGNNIWQSLDISFALNNLKDSTTQQTNTQIAVGLKVSLLRGKLNNTTEKYVAASSKFLNQYAQLKTDYEKKVLQDPAFKNLSGADQQAALLKADAQARTDAHAVLDSVKAIDSRIDFTRTGFMLDLAGGLAYNFVNQANGSLYNSGAWLTGGYRSQGGLSALAIIRFLYDPSVNNVAGSLVNQPVYHTFDYGARLLYDAPGDKFTFGSELVYRDVSDNPAVKSSWRYAISTDYQIGKNQVLSFNIGRDFDGTINKGGSLLAALNFIMGFGNNRPAK